MPIKVRVGQSDAIKILSSASGGSVTSQNAINVIGGIASVTALNVTGISTFVGNIDVTGIATALNLNSTTFNSNSLNISGLSTFVGIVTTKNDLYVGGNLFVGEDLTFDEINGRNLNISGIGTVNTLNVTGTLTAGLIDGGSFWWQDQILDKD